MEKLIYPIETQDYGSEHEESNFLDLLITVFKRKRLIAGGALIMAVISAASAFVMTPVFEATTRLMPPQQSQGSSSLAAQLMTTMGGGGGAGGGAASLFGSGDMGELYVQLLQTDNVLDNISEKFDIKKLYKVKTREEARNVLMNNVLSAQADSKSGMITITVSDKVPERASEIANAFVDELKKLLKNVSLSDDTKRRKFFENELKKAHESLKKSEEDFQGFQENTGVFKIDDQASAVLQNITSLKAQIAAKEVQLKVMKTYSTTFNPDYKKVEEELRALNTELKNLEDKQDQSKPDIMLRSDQMPEYGTEYIRKVRDFKYNELLYELLVKQYEGARLDEAKESAAVQVIHPASPAEKKARPKRSLIIVLGAVIGFLAFTLVSFLIEVSERASMQKKNRKRINNLCIYMKRL